MNFLRIILEETFTIEPQELCCFVITPEQCFILNSNNESLSIRANGDRFYFTIKKEGSPMHYLHNKFYGKITELQSQISRISVIHDSLSVDKNGYWFVDLVFLIFETNTDINVSHIIPIGRFKLPGDADNTETRIFLQRIGDWTNRVQIYLS